MKHKIYAAMFSILTILIIIGLSGNEAEKISGRTTTKLMALLVENGTCFFTLNEGWNLASFRCYTEDMSPQAYFAGLNETLISIHQYNPSLGLDKWKAYNPNLPKWVVQDLGNIDREKGYWIRMNKTAFFWSNGSTFSPTRMGIKKGWNLVGYPGKMPNNINDSLYTYMNYDWSVVYMYNSSDSVDPWKMYILNAPANTTLDLYQFSHNFGYWVNASKTGEWYLY